MRFIVFRSALVCLGLLSYFQSSVRAEDGIEPRVVKYPGLADAIRQLKGKVVVVDFWADF